MEVVLYIIFLAGIILFNVSRSKKKSGKTPVPNKPRQPLSVPNRPKPEIPPAARKARAVGDRARKAASDWTRQLYEADPDRHMHYDQASLDYCDSNVPASGGISFRDLPPGADELAYLKKWNSQREKLLQQSLESRE